MAQTIHDHIATDPAICGGKPHVTGTRIRVIDIYAWHERQGMSPDEIVSAFPSLTLADVHAALAYYWDHRDHVDQQAEADRAFADALRRQSPSKLIRRLTGTDTGDADTVSS